MSSKERIYGQIYVNKFLGNWWVPNRYENLEQIGSGAFGFVWLGIADAVKKCQQKIEKTNSAFDTERGMKVAIKKIARPLQSELHAKRTYREIRTLKHMHHDNVIGLFDIFKSEEPKDFDIYIVTHLMESDLSTIIKQQKLKDIHIQLLVYQLLRGVKYVHSAGIIHRDLKPSNVAVNGDCELRILDFGLARPSESTSASGMTGYVVTRWYRAPEVMLNWTHYNKTVDVWAIGCIMAEMITGQPLFPGKDQIDQLKQTLAVTGNPGPELLAKMTSDAARKFVLEMPTMKKKDFHEMFAGANPLAIDLLEKMLELDPDKRISVEQALNHEYLKQFADSSDEPVSEPYNKSFDDQDLDLSQWRKLLLDEITSFIPPTVEEYMES